MFVFGCVETWMRFHKHLKDMFVLGCVETWMRFHLRAVSFRCVSTWVRFHYGVHFSPQCAFLTSVHICLHSGAFTLGFVYSWVRLCLGAFTLGYV